MKIKFGILKEQAHFFVSNNIKNMLILNLILDLKLFYIYILFHFMIQNPLRFFGDYIAFEEFMKNVQILTISNRDYYNKL